MSRSSRLLAAGAVSVALAAGAWTGWPRTAQADAPSGATTSVPASGDTVTTPPSAAAAALAAVAPVVLEAPVAFAPGQQLDIELPVRTEARRDAVRITATFRDADGAVTGEQVATARITGGDWRTVAFRLDVVDRSVTVDLATVAVAGPVETGPARITSITSSAAPAPGGE